MVGDGNLNYEEVERLLAAGRMVELYLKAGANPYLQDSNGSDAFDLAGDRRSPYP